MRGNPFDIPVNPVNISVGTIGGVCHFMGELLPQSEYGQRQLNLVKHLTFELLLAWVHKQNADSK